MYLVYVNKDFRLRKQVKLDRGIIAGQARLFYRQKNEDLGKTYKIEIRNRNFVITEMLPGESLR